MSFDSTSRFMVVCIVAIVELDTDFGDLQDIIGVVNEILADEF